MAGDGAAENATPDLRRGIGAGEEADRLLRDLVPDRDLDPGPDLDLARDLGLDPDLDLDPMEAAPGPDRARMEADRDPAVVVVGRTGAADIANLWRQ